MNQDRAAGIKLLILDVDGVLTDGRIVMHDRGEETKCFSVKDGQGLRLLMKAGIAVVLITGRKSRVVDIRARDLGIKEIHQGVKDKGGLCRALIAEKNLAPEQVCSVGDDLPDIPMLRQSGLAVAVSDAAEEVRKIAHLITDSKGGAGAVREICEIILKAQGRWHGLVAEYMTEGN